MEYPRSIYLIKKYYLNNRKNWNTFLLFIFFSMGGDKMRREVEKVAAVFLMENSFFV